MKWVGEGKEEEERVDTDDLNCADLMWAIMWLAKGGEERINEDENVDCEDRHRHRLPMIQLLTPPPARNRGARPGEGGVRADRAGSGSVNAHQARVAQIRCPARINGGESP